MSLAPLINEFNTDGGSKILLLFLIVLINSGFKKSKSYKVEELPESVGAYYGWKEVGEEGRKDFEIRIYNSHEDAIEFGKFYADEATGENAIIRKSDASWSTLGDYRGRYRRRSSCHLSS